jgi:PAS domain S-box-containing protein
MYISINEGFTRIMGYTEEDAIGKTSLEMNIWFNPDDRKKLVKELESKGEARNFEARFLSKSGTIIYGLMSASLIDLDGVPHILSVARDITIRKRAEEELTQEQYLINTLLNNLPDHVYFKDLESRFIRINQSHALSFGLDDPDQATGKTDFDFHSPEHARQAYNDEQAIIQTGQPLTKEERLVHADSPDSWVYITKLPLRNEEGKIIGTFGISRDITKHKKVEEELAAERNLLRTLIDNMPDRIYAKDLDSRFIVCNKALVKRMGMSGPEDVIGKSDFDLLPHDLAARYFANEQEIIHTGQPLINHEESMGNVSGTTRWSLATKVPLHDIQGKIIGIVGIGRDITEHKLAEEEIKLKNELLQTINAEKDKFFSILAHDLRGPLSAFVAATQILTEEIQTMTLKEIREITVSMKESANNIYGLLENLLEWSRLRRGGMDFVPEKLNLKEKIEACIDVLSESARKKRIELTFSIPGEMEVFVDNHMFDTIIRNLVSNAIKFTSPGGKVNVTAGYNNEHSIEFKVSDTGIGMTPELKNKLFLISEKTSRQGTEGEMSTGLGLLLCKEFIEKHGGKIWVESEEGKGSTFSFTIGQFENLKMR